MTTQRQEAGPDLGGLALPAEDRVRSPHTGLARAHWEAAADAMLAALRPFASPRHAFVHPPGGRPSQHGRASDGLEGYARSFLMAAFRLRGAGGDAPGDLAERYAEGLIAGTEPDGKEAWPAIAPLSQPMVEAASVAIGLFETRPWIWDALPDAARQRAVDWLSGSLGKRHWPNNWLLFQVVVNAFLASVGAPFREAEMERDLDLIDAMYRSDGWYSDGPGHCYDHYVGWAMHLYPVLWARMRGAAADPERVSRHRARLSRFLEDAHHLVAADGAPLHQGRSLIYRFAAVAPFFAGALADATPLAPGATRRVASGCLRHFLEHGALDDGVLSMGWHAAFPLMAQEYSGPASPYWASKAFLGLLLPADHPVWTATEEPLPVERGDFVRAMPEPGFLAVGTRADGMLRFFNHKSDHLPMPGRSDGGPFYRKLAYSTHTGPELEETPEADDLDAQVALVPTHGGAASRRARIHPIGVADRAAASAFYPLEGTVVEGRHFPLWLERVETVSIAWRAGEIRVHHAASFGARRVRDAGFALAGPDPLEVEVGPGFCAVRRKDGLASAIFSLRGLEDAEARRSQAVNPFGPHSATPFLTAPSELPVEAIYSSYGLLTGAPLDTGSIELPRIQVDGRCVEIECPDGERFFVQLVAPEVVDRSLGALGLSGRVRYARSSPDGTSYVWRETG